MSKKHANASPGRATIAWRTAAALLGSYVFSWGFIALVLAGAYALGLPFHDAEHLGSMLGLLAYLVAFLWAFAARSLPRVGLVLVAGGLVMSGAASLVQHSLLT